MVNAVKMNSRKKKFKAGNIVDVLIIIFFAVFVAICLIPILNVLSLSVTTDEYALVHKGMLFPSFKHLTGVAYIAVVKSKAIYTSFLLSIAITVFATVIHLATAMLAGFALSVKKLPFRRVMMFSVLFTMLFSSGLIPYYLTLSSYGMVDTIWVLFIPGAVSPYSIFLTRNFITNIPDSLKEAAELDGANPFWMFIRIIVPLCVPIIATLALFCAVGKWNDWTTAAIFIKSKHELRPFVNVLQNVVVNPDPQNATGVEKGGIAFSNALIVMSIVPVTIMYLCTQKFLLKGLLVGSVKG